MQRHPELPVRPKRAEVDLDAVRVGRRPLSARGFRTPGRVLGDE
jgi:hypothetical protein